MNQIQNELMHYGVLGMHWGKRKAQAQAWTKEAGKSIKNNLRHPNLTGEAYRASLKAGSTKDKFRRALLYSNTKEIKDVNARAAGLIAGNSERKAKIKEANSWKGSGKGKAVAKSVVAGLVASNLGGMAVLGLTKNMKAAQVSANFLAVYGGVKYYKSLKKDNNR